MRPLPGEPLTRVRYDLVGPEMVLEVPARHSVELVETDADTGRPVVWIDEATERARPVHVRLKLIASDADAPNRSHLLAELHQDGAPMHLYGSYLGVVSDEN
jgi:hypothetical protein